MPNASLGLSMIWPMPRPRNAKAMSRCGSCCRWPGPSECKTAHCRAEITSRASDRLGALSVLALADRDKPAARLALIESIRLIDGLDGPAGAGGVHRPTVHGRLQSGRVDSADCRNRAGTTRRDFLEGGRTHAQERDGPRARRCRSSGRLSCRLPRVRPPVADLLVSEATASALRSSIANVWTAWTTIRARATYDPRAW